MQSFIILTINPGSTSTKIGLFEDKKLIFSKNLKHSVEDLEKYDSIISQYQFRKNLILKVLKDENVELKNISAVVARGGLLKPIQSGVYEVNSKMIEDLRSCKYGEHASNLGGIIAKEVADDIKEIKAYIADPVVVDEMEPIAKLSGHPEFQRTSIFHALNQKATAKKHAEKFSKKYSELNLIVAHLGGGISVGAHKKGRVIDVNQALNGDGPYSPERSGTLPVFDLVKMCFSGKYTIEQVKQLIVGKGGFAAYLGTNDASEVERLALEGNKEADLYHSGMAYQVAKEIGAMGAVLDGEVDFILLTGGIAYNQYFVEKVEKKVKYLAPVYVYPGEDELLALAENGLRVLRDEEKVKIYAFNI